MAILSARDFVIETEAAPEELEERLRRAVAPRRRFSRRKRERPFTGRVGTTSFELRPVLCYRNSFAPVARGSFASDAIGTRVEVHLRMPRAVRAFMTLWLAFAAAVFVVGLVNAAASPSEAWLALAGLALLAFGFGLTAAAFSYEARRIRANLVRLLVDGADPTDLREPDLSWLLDLSLRAAEPPERRFNVVFLVAYFASAALAVLAWDRTASACTNPQYDRPLEYSCPSGTRIFLTWCLLAALVATGLASRFALHRRARRVYPMLLLLVVAIGGAAVWLLVHHPRWGVPR